MKHGPVEDLVPGIYIGRFLGNKCLISFSGIAEWLSLMETKLRLVEYLDLKVS